MRLEVFRLEQKIQRCKSELKKAEKRLLKIRDECEHQHGTLTTTYHNEMVDEGDYGGGFQTYEDKTWTCSKCGITKKESKRVPLGVTV
jgi:rubrerythrin